MAPNETLNQKQWRFAQMVAQLIPKAKELGFECALGEAERPQAVADLYAKQGKGISTSLHLIRLAIDLHLFKDGKYLTETEDHRQLGEYWESIGGTWGGRFGDGNHYSLAHDGRK
jgi:hypothetical protein